MIHRVVGGDRSAWVTQGDNSESQDRWSITSSDVLGVAKFHIPFGGQVVALMKSWLVIALFGGLAVALLLWPDKEEEAKPAEARRRSEPAG